MAQMIQNRKKYKMQQGKNKLFIQNSNSHLVQSVYALRTGNSERRCCVPSSDSLGKFQRQGRKDEFSS